jgi:hypothetical protein
MSTYRLPDGTPIYGADHNDVNQGGNGYPSEYRDMFRQSRQMSPQDASNAAAFDGFLSSLHTGQQAPEPSEPHWWQQVRKHVLASVPKLVEAVAKVASDTVAAFAPEAEGGILPFGRIGRRGRDGGLAPKAITCAVCHKQFTSSQPHAKTCSNSCKQKLYRRKKKKR